MACVVTPTLASPSSTAPAWPATRLNPTCGKCICCTRSCWTPWQAAGLPVQPGDMGENITTCGLDLLGLSAGTRLRIGASAVVEVTGLRNPCAQIENFQPGLLAAVLERRHDGSLVRKAGVMGIVVEDGMVNAGDPFTVVHQPARFQALQPV